MICSVSNSLDSGSAYRDEGGSRAEDPRNDIIGVS